ncbi:MAG: DUF1385 domain-containing protein [Fimbriimonadaceae bacterium]
MAADPLTLPVVALMRSVESLRPQDSLRLAAEFLRGSEISVLPVLDDETLLGIVSERSIAACLERGLTPDDPVTEAIGQASTIEPQATGADALRRFSQTGGEPLIVVDGSGHVLGALAPSDLFPKKQRRERPHMIGGMATPFGVYLTTGTVRSGPGDLALILTGALLFSMAAVAAIIAELAIGSMHLRPSMAANARDAISIAMFLVFMRLAPISGIHAAEHKVVHAIERGEELVPQIVKRMPRVHPRCGTNIAVGVSLFLGIGSANLVPYREVQLLIALLVTMALWRPLGSLVQLFITTRPPSDKHIAYGIKSGEELLAKYAEVHAGSPALWQRLWYSGLPHVIAGSMAAYFLITGAFKLFGIDVAV